MLKHSLRELRTVMAVNEYLDVVCGKCAWRESFGLAQMAKWLRAAGKLRADRQPEAEIVYELFRSAAPQLPCPNCGRKSLTLAACSDDAWGDEGLCEACRRPIPRARLAALPGVRLCADCQSAEETGQSPRSVEYCPRCGAPLEVRLSRAAGVTRYVMTCTGNPPCRSRSPL